MLRTWQKAYNTVRPHQALSADRQALGYRTPQQFLEQWNQRQRKEKVYGIA